MSRAIMAGGPSALALPFGRGAGPPLAWSVPQPGSAKLKGRLLRYLRGRLDACALRLCSGPTEIPGGWEAASYQFGLASLQALPADLKEDLVLRQYANEAALPRLRREFAAMQFLVAHGYPVAKPVLCEESSAPLGGPFLIREHVAGPTLLEYILSPIWRLWQVTDAIAQTLARLHTLPTKGFPNDDEPLLERTLGEMRSAILEHDLSGLQSGLNWLEQRQPSQTTRSIVHLDFHPGNIVVSAQGQLIVLDWSDAAIGDRHADLGQMEMLIRCSPLHRVPLLTIPFVRIGRLILCKRIRRFYSPRLPIDPIRLNYYRAWAALRQLCRYGRWLHEGADREGLKGGPEEDVIEHAATIEAYFTRLTGVRIQLRPLALKVLAHASSVP